MFRQSAVLFARTKNVNKVPGMENSDCEKNFRSLQTSGWANIIFGYNRMPEVEGSICETHVLNSVTLWRCILNCVGEI